MSLTRCCSVEARGHWKAWRKEEGVEGIEGMFILKKLPDVYVSFEYRGRETCPLSPPSPLACTGAEMCRERQRVSLWRPAP